MTLETPLWLEPVPGDPDIEYAAQEDRTLFDALVSGSGVAGSTDLAVSQRGAGANFSADVAAGHGIIPGSSVADQGKYAVQSTSTANIPLASAPGAGFNRYDLIYAQVRDKQADGGSAYDWVIDKVTGVTTNVVPAVPANAIPLAQVGPITNGTASITTALIADRRTYYQAAGMRARSAIVATQQSTTSTSYTDLSTAGPVITVPLYAGQIVLVTVSARCSNSSGAGFGAAMSFAVSGADTQVAADSNCIEMDDNAGATLQRTTVYAAPVSGIYTFTAKYKAINATTATFVNRRMIIGPG